MLILIPNLYTKGTVGKKLHRLSDNSRFPFFPSPSLSLSLYLFVSLSLFSGIHYKLNKMLETQHGEHNFFAKHLQIQKKNNKCVRVVLFSKKQRENSFVLGLVKNPSFLACFFISSPMSPLSTVFFLKIGRELKSFPADSPVLQYTVEHNQTTRYF